MLEDIMETKGVSKSDISAVHLEDLRDTRCNGATIKRSSSARGLTMFE
jgi:hypothetical protein